MNRWLPLIPLLAFGLGWELLSWQYPPALLPSPLEVINAMWAKSSLLLEATASTALAAACGLLASSLGGIGGAMLFERSRWMERALYPYAVLLQTVPIVAIAPLLVVWLGYGLPPAIASASIVAFFPVLTSANLGLRSVGPEQVELFSLYGARWWHTLTLLRLPAALPFLFSGLRTAAGLSVIGAIVGEFVGSNGFPPSLGYVVLRSSRSADTALTFGAVFSSALLALGFFGMVRLLEHRVIGSWHGEGAPS